MTVIKDNRGRVPNYVISDGKLIHQPTGLSVRITPMADYDASLRLAMRSLQQKIREAQ